MRGPRRVKLCEIWYNTSFWFAYSWRIAKLPQLASRHNGSESHGERQIVEGE